MSFNVSMVPSPMDLLLVLPRLAQRAAAFAFYTVPEHLDDIISKINHGGSMMIAEATAAERLNATASNTTKELFRSSATAASQSSMITAAASATDPPIPAAVVDSVAEGFFSFQTLRSAGGMFSYLMTRWAIGTFIVSLLFNRTQFYASSRVPIRPDWTVRLVLYIVPITALLLQARSLAQAIRCQTSPNWSQIRYGDASKTITQDYAGEGGFLHYFTSALLFWQSEEDSCVAVNMGYSTTEIRLVQLSGSMSLLWPLFLTFCLSQFVETLACALQGHQQSAETGMTIFEHSLAFAEAETIMTKPWEAAGRVAASFAFTNAEATEGKVTREFLRGFMNVPPEVLLIGFISSLNHLSSNILAVAGMRSRFRLVNTTVWALSYMTAFVWEIYRYVSTPLAGGGTSAAELSVRLIRFPTVCIVGFIPHLVVLIGILFCATVYGMALLITALSPPEGGPQPASVMERLRTAYRNLQANVHLSAGTSITVGWQDDFYTSLIKAGFAILTSASEAVYLNEGVRVKVASMTWLERKRYDELARNRGILYCKTMETIPPDMRTPGGSIANGMTIADSKTTDGNGKSSSGYAVERKSKSKESEDSLLNTTQFRDRGVGFVQRQWRWVMASRYIKGIFWLCVSMGARLFLWLLVPLRLRHQPRWLQRLAAEPRSGKHKRSKAATRKASKSRRDGLEFWLMQSDGSLRLPVDSNVDVEKEMRRRIRSQDHSAILDVRSEDERVAQQCYEWWKSGGWWGDVDGSGEYSIPASELDDDTTSMISMSTNADGDAWAWRGDDSDGEGDSGRRTPTQSNPNPSFSPTRDATPFESAPANDALSASQLADLLDPQNGEQQAEARMLARHLRFDAGIMTRSRYNRQVALDKARVLATPGHGRRVDERSSGFVGMTVEEEERELEHYMLSRRHRVRPKAAAAASSWQQGADGAGSSGPSCVVCQDSPRTILVWPCGCLSMCDECRIGLATRNYNSCICCRTQVGAFSRIWVP